jgi:hypothetical protein
MGMVVLHSASFADDTASAVSTPVYLDESQPIETRIDDLLSRLTLEEKFPSFMPIPNSQPPRFRVCPRTMCYMKLCC